jgi:hypothetical protein
MPIVWLAALLALPVVCCSQEGLTYPGRVVDLQYCPSDRDIVSFEKQMTHGTEVWIWSRSQGLVKKIGSRVTESFEDLWDDEFRSIRGKTVVAIQLDWCPVLHADGKQWFVYVGGGEGGLDIYLGNLQDAERDPVPIVKDPGVDQMPRWSPDGSKLVFTSSRTGHGDIYVIDNMRDILRKWKRPSRMRPRVRRLTTNPSMDIYPCWDPQGQWIAYSSEVAGTQKVNHEIAVIPLSSRRHDGAPILLTLTDQEDETKPSWSPSGSYIVFFGSKRSDPEKYFVRAVEVKQSKSRLEGFEPAKSLSYYICATDAIPRRHRGASWANIADRNYVTYAALDNNGANAIWIADIDRWAGKHGIREFKLELERNTILDRAPDFCPLCPELCYIHMESERDTLAFASDLPIPDYRHKPRKSISRGHKLRWSLLFPGLGQIKSGHGTWGRLLSSLGALTIGGAIGSEFKYSGLRGDVEDIRGTYLDASHPDDIEDLYHEWGDKYDSAKTWRDRRTYLISAAIALYLISLADCILGGDECFEVGPPVRCAAGASTMRGMYGDNSQMRRGRLVCCSGNSIRCTLLSFEF